MYVPPAFREDRIEILHAAMREAGLATLVSLGADGLVASHVPMLLDEKAGPNGTLYGHLAKANPHAAGGAPGVEALAIFHGPEAYITPSWYETKRQTGKVVPTWNYVAIHASGPLEMFDDADRLLDLVTRLTRRHEGGRAVPWAVSDAPEEFIRAQLKGIVGFALPIARLEGKWKMSQNRPAADRRGVAEGLRGEGKDDVAALVPVDEG
ncbi:FMN-binding negative transcriptional regulator [Inquilinus limosus]|uniref:FMN-binding negative transcriptional regulator n=1 Tax=Inquilinus limosus TaxID=171674 RepID=UPI000479A859|nr:FMN-binding negative transcriptional regulator [Inquilinus limosus]